MSALGKARYVARERMDILWGDFCHGLSYKIGAVVVTPGGDARLRAGAHWHVPLMPSVWRVMHLCSSVYYRFDPELAVSGLSVLSWTSQGLARAEGQSQAMEMTTAASDFSQSVLL